MRRDLLGGINSTWTAAGVVNGKAKRAADMPEESKTANCNVLHSIIHVVACAAPCARRKPYRKPLTLLYFALPLPNGNHGEQFFYFTSLVGA